VSGAVHRIRLRSPWQCHVTPKGIAWRRRFGRPTGVQASERLFLCFSSFITTATATLNGELLGVVPVSSAAVSFDVTAALAARNELEIEFVGDCVVDAPSELPGEVALEIRSAVAETPSA
jgi:hypothetical protein